ncbi:hypothetical protein BC834DRAFT_360509 [Gloeopeniophorella convolvens]|nr:hypothetical protein BC834DRAFT_360509 [Gloeopeniophorella convolvens]
MYLPWGLRHVQIVTLCAVKAVCLINGLLGRGRLIVMCFVRSRRSTSLGRQANLCQLWPIHKSAPHSRAARNPHSDNDERSGV